MESREPRCKRVCTEPWTQGTGVDLFQAVMVEFRAQFDDYVSSMRGYVASAIDQLLPEIVDAVKNRADLDIRGFFVPENYDADEVAKLFAEFTAVLPPGCRIYETIHTKGEIKYTRLHVECTRAERVPDGF
jgi:hypothetical protein